jgi:hypothetical protein
VTQLVLNPYLVGLGILLLEIAEEKSFEQWIREEGTSLDCRTEEHAALAWRWLKKESTKIRLGGDKYGEVIEKCLISRVTFSQEEGRLSIESRAGIYRDVVQELEIIYDMFTGDL